MINTMQLDRIKSVVSYDAETGELRRSGRVLSGKNGFGYIQTTIDGQFFYGHRLAWFLTYGELPSVNIDHANGDPSDNRLCNLRLATQVENMANARISARNTTGFKGVTRHSKNGTFVARIVKNRKQISLGCFASAQEAHAAYARAAKELSGEFARAD